MIKWLSIIKSALFLIADGYSRYYGLRRGWLRAWMYVIVEQQGVLSYFHSASLSKCLGNISASFLAPTWLRVFLKSGGSLERLQLAAPYQLANFQEISYLWMEECFDGFWKYVSCFLFICCCCCCHCIVWFYFVLKQAWPPWNLQSRLTSLPHVFLVMAIIIVKICHHLFKFSLLKF